MSSFLESFDSLSYKKVISISALLSILLVVPVVVYLVDQQTRISSRAAYEKPKIASEPKPTPGLVPAVAPQVGRAFPWVGKEGDIIWIQGKHFGQNPVKKSLFIGGVQIPDINIAMWQDDIIQAVIPEKVSQGSVVEVKVGDHPSSKSLPLVIYDKDSKARLHKNQNIITGDNIPTVKTALVWTGDDEISTVQTSVDIKPNGNASTVIFDTKGLPILTILLLDDKGKIVPYAADPIEFDF